MKCYNIHHIIIGVAKRSLSCLLALASLTVVSCVSDNNATSDAVSDYTNAQVQSYGDLFDVFWKVMNQRYNYLNEQEGDFALDWDAVYAEYKPKFDALRTFNRSAEWTTSQIQADHDKANTYFGEIVKHIRDQHFRVMVKLPVSHTSFESVTYSGNAMKRDGVALPLWMRMGYLSRQLEEDDDLISYNSQSFSMLGGFVKGEPGTYYLSFSNFALGSNCTYTYRSQYLPNDQSSGYLLTKPMIEALADELVSKESARMQAKQAACQLYDAFEVYLASTDVKGAADKMTAYTQKNDCDGLLSSVCKAYEEMPIPFPSFTNVDVVQQMQQDMLEWLQGKSEYESLYAETAFRDSFLERLAAYLCYVRELDAFSNDIGFTISHPLVELYPRCFIANLKSGKIKKLILDLRGNGGGAVSDTRLLTDYLVTRSAVYGYVRQKEDNNPYSYTPWVPQCIEKTSSSIGREIPIVTILDQGSASMSETTALILKSQGAHVKLVGRNSMGALSMLGSSEMSNGGWNGWVTDYLYFYMPFMAVKDLYGNILEGYGLTPDEEVSPLSADEASAIYSMSSGASDKSFEKAVEILK